MKFDRESTDKTCEATEKRHVYKGKERRPHLRRP